jgi:hypothetical protein
MTWLFYVPVDWSVSRDPAEGRPTMRPSDMGFVTQLNLTMHEGRKRSLSKNLGKIQPQLSRWPATTLRLNSGDCPIELDNEWSSLSKFVRRPNVFR